MFDLNNFRTKKINSLRRKISRLISSSEKLDLSSYDELVTDDLINLIVNKCPKLKSIYLYGSRITDAALISISKNCPELADLRLSFCRNITDRGVMSIAHGCGNLISLDVCFNYDITDVGVVDISKNCPNITQLVIDGCKITDATLNALGKNSPYLTGLSLVHCFEITGEGLQTLVSRCSNLRWLALGEYDFGQDVLFDLTKYPLLRVFID